MKIKLEKKKEMNQKNKKWFQEILQYVQFLYNTLFFYKHKAYKHT